MSAYNTRRVPARRPLGAVNVQVQENMYRMDRGAFQFVNPWSLPTKSRYTTRAMSIPIVQEGEISQVGGTILHSRQMSAVTFGAKPMSARPIGVSTTTSRCSCFKHYIFLRLVYKSPP